MFQEERRLNMIQKLREMFNLNVSMRREFGHVVEPIKLPPIKKKGTMNYKCEVEEIGYHTLINVFGDFVYENSKYKWRFVINGIAGKITSKKMERDDVSILLNKNWVMNLWPDNYKEGEINCQRILDHLRIIESSTDIGA